MRPNLTPRWIGFKYVGNPDGYSTTGISTDCLELLGHSTDPVDIAAPQQAAILFAEKCRASFPMVEPDHCDVQVQYVDNGPCYVIGYLSYYANSEWKWYPEAEGPHPDAELIAAYEAFHAIDRTYTLNTPPIECRGDEEKEEAWRSAHCDQWHGMIRALMLRQPQTPAGLAVLLMAVMHEPDFVEARAEPHPSFPAWNGYSMPPGLRKDDERVRWLAHIAQCALRLAPELLPQPAGEEVHHAA